MTRKLIAEALGTAFLLAIVVGSGVMAERLAGGNAALALLANTVATGAGLFVLIEVFGPLSGAHFNPVVSLVSAVRGEMRAGEAASYAVVQVIGAVAGVTMVHLMFGLPVWQVSTKLRPGWNLVFAEGVATFGLLSTILFVARSRPAAISAAVGIYISAAYWFTASTSFANPAAVAGRMLSDTFAGIAPVSAPGFVAGQLAGALVALGFFSWITKGKYP